MSVINNILLASSILTSSSWVLAQNVEVENEVQKNKTLIFETLGAQYQNKFWNHNVIWDQNHKYFQDKVLPKIRLPITEDISWWVFKSHISWSVVWIKYQLNNSQLQKDHISIWIGKRNRAEITYNLKF